jgi:hypothetical protein
VPQLDWLEEVLDRHDHERDDQVDRAEHGGRRVDQRHLGINVHGLQAGRRERAGTCVGERASEYTRMGECPHGRSVREKETREREREREREERERERREREREEREREERDRERQRKRERAGGRDAQSQQQSTPREDGAVRCRQSRKERRRV